MPAQETPTEEARRGRKPHAPGDVIDIEPNPSALQAASDALAVIGPRQREIAGIPAYPDLASVPGPIHIVDFVTPPDVTRSVLEEAARLDLPAVWLQDGSWDDAVLEVAARGPFKTVYQACIMVAANYR